MSYRSVFMIGLSRSPFWDSEPPRQGPTIIHILRSTEKSRSWQPNISQQFKKLLIATFTSAGQMSLSWATLVQSTPPSYFFTMQFSISYQCLYLPSSFFPSGFPLKTLHAPLLHPTRFLKAKYYTLFFTVRNSACPTYLKHWTMSNMTTG